VVVNFKYYTLTIMMLLVNMNGTYAGQKTPLVVEPSQACVIAPQRALTPEVRETIAKCLGWIPNEATPMCRGAYRASNTEGMIEQGETNILADEVSFYPQGVSKLKGHVDVRQGLRIVNAETAYVYRDAKTQQVTEIKLVGDVQYDEPGRFMRARQVVINPNNKAGRVDDVLYRFDVQRAHALLPAWGRASFIERFVNEDYLLRYATYSTCAPRDKAWQLEAEEIRLNEAKGVGVAKNALLRVGDMPLIYAPYFSFPTSNARKSGFLMPIYGYSNVGGLDLAAPYYWNIAPNYDATLTPHAYSRRGVMLGGDVRFLTERSAGVIGGNVLPRDAAYKTFLSAHEESYPQLRGDSTDRWSFMLHEGSQLANNLRMTINYQQVSDDYYLQDFSSNLAISTENQLLRQGDLTYTTDHWLLRSVLQSYQTLHPINQSDVTNVYERLPQLQAMGAYDELPFNGNLSLLGEFDYFRWPSNSALVPQGPRYHANPVLSFPQIKPWGYITPEVQLVENYYDLHAGNAYASTVINRTIPRLSVDSGLSFEREHGFMGRAYTQTLEPRLYYLNVPYQNQSLVPSFDSAYMIFNTDELFRTNRFSGFDRISDANQLAYAITSRLLSDSNGQEKASVTLGQLRYFANRRVQLCYNVNGDCQDDSLMLGYLSPKASASPIASKATYQMNSSWGVSGDYVWDVYTHATNNSDLNLHYRPEENKMFTLGYAYLVSGNVLDVNNNPLQNNALHQATVAYAWPLTESWSSLGAYSYNISKQYGMTTFLGVQYDTCCWAVRLLGGRTFKSLSPGALTPQYNNNVYFQVLLKGLGSVAVSDPASAIETYLPGYPNLFSR
jgi:LPS-assembly protein